RTAPVLQQAWPRMQNLRISRTESCAHGSWFASGKLSETTRPTSTVRPRESAKACTHLESDTTGLSAPLPPRALASGGERSAVGGGGGGWGALVRNCTTPHPARRLPAPRHPPHRHSASKTRVNALSAGGGMVPATPSLPTSKMCACTSAKAGTQKEIVSGFPL